MSISKWDDFFVHQTRHTLNRWESDDPGAFERHFILCHNADGSLYVMVGFAIYPNRGVCDAGASIRYGNVQRNIFVSRQLETDRDPAQLVIGPLSMRCVEPLKKWHIALAENDYGIRFTLQFESRTIPWGHNKERVEKFFTGGFDQALRFSGEVSFDDKRFDAGGFYGGRNHTWGDHRPLGPQAASGTFGLDLVLWGFAHFADCCLILPVSLTRRAPPQTNKPAANWTEHGDEVSQWQDGAICYHDGRTIPIKQIYHRIAFESEESRAYRKIELLLKCMDGSERHLIAIPKSRECYLRGVGYGGKQGTDFGVFHVEGDEYDVSFPRGIGDPLYGANDRVCDFEMDRKPGVGFLENVMSEDPGWQYRPTW